jgi:hypothetical protein
MRSSSNHSPGANVDVALPSQTVGYLALTLPQRHQVQGVADSDGQISQLLLRVQKLLGPQQRECANPGGIVFDDVELDAHRTIFPLHQRIDPSTPVAPLPVEETQAQQVQRQLGLVQVLAYMGEAPVREWAEGKRKLEEERAAVCLLSQDGRVELLVGEGLVTFEPDLHDFAILCSLCVGDTRPGQREDGHT